MENHRTFNLTEVLKSRYTIRGSKHPFFGPELKNVFTGAALINWLSFHHNPFHWKNHSQSADWIIDRGLNPTPEERQQLTRHIYEELYDPALAHQLIYPVDHNSGFFDSEGPVYRFVTDQFDLWRQDPQILNLYNYRKGTNTLFCELEDESQVPRVQQIMQEMKEIAEKIFKDYTEEDGNVVDYERLKDSEVWKKQYIRFVNKLAYMNMSGLINNDNLTKAFFINVYNLLAIHIIIAQYSAKKKPEITSDTFNVYKYNLGGHNYTLNDIQHGILRKNRHGAKATFDAGTSLFSWGSKGPRLNKADPRYKYMVKTFDSRVNFALNFGSVSCPALRYYNEKSIEKELRSAVRGYWKKDLEVVERKGKEIVEVGGLFKEYLSEYGEDSDGLLDRILKDCDDSEMKKEIGKMKMEDSVEFKKVSYEVNHVRRVD